MFARLSGFQKLAATASAANKLKTSLENYNEDDHAPVPLITGYDAFRLMFGFYRLPILNFQPSLFMLPRAILFNLIKASAIKSIESLPSTPPHIS